MADTPPPWTIQLTPAAAKSLRNLDGSIATRIRSAIDALGTDPRPSGVKKLVGSEDQWRIRVGDYRVIYEIEDAVLLVLIVRIADRKEVYR